MKEKQPNLPSEKVENVEHKQFEFEMPYEMREATTVAQAIAQHVFKELITRDHKKKETDENIALPVPLHFWSMEMTPKEDDYKTTLNVFTFGYGVNVTVDMSCSLAEDKFHQIWKVREVKADYSPEVGDSKVDKIWTSEELKEIASLWGNEPSVKE